MRSRNPITLCKRVAVICFIVCTFAYFNPLRLESGVKIQPEGEAPTPEVFPKKLQQSKSTSDLSLDKTQTQTSTKDQPSSSTENAPANIWDRYPVSFPCPYTVQRIGRAGDGGKNVCGFEEIKKLPQCLVYSFGISNEVTFEDMVLEQTNCTVHMHDVISVLPNPAALLKKFRGRITYSELGIGTTRGNSLKAIMTRNGHSYIEILKMDIEGGEWNALSQAVLDFPDGLPIGQLQVEIHLGQWKPPGTPELQDWYRSLEAAGLRTFYKEVNPNDPLLCWEYSFISVKFGTFTTKKNLLI